MALNRLYQALLYLFHRPSEARLMPRETLDQIYERATKKVQEACDYCDGRRNYVCTYHEGWADGFEASLSELAAEFGE